MGTWAFRGKLALLGGPWDLVSICNWAYNPKYSPLKGLIGVTPVISRCISLVISSC